MNLLLFGGGCIPFQCLRGGRKSVQVHRDSFVQSNPTVVRNFNHFLLRPARRPPPPPPPPPHTYSAAQEDYPSSSQTEMRRWMKDQKDGTNFIKCWPIEGHDFFGQWEHHEGRLQDVRERGGRRE